MRSRLALRLAGTTKRGASAVPGRSLPYKLRERLVECLQMPAIVTGDGENGRVHEVDFLGGVDRQRRFQDGQVRAGEAFVIEEPSRVGSYRNGLISRKPSTARPCCMSSV